MYEPPLQMADNARSGFRLRERQEQMNKTSNIQVLNLAEKISGREFLTLSQVKTVYDTLTRLQSYYQQYGSNRQTQEFLMLGGNIGLRWARTVLLNEGIRV